MKDSRVLFLAIILLSLSMLGFAFLPYLSSLVESRNIGKAHSSLGEQIYFSGRGENGRQIPFGYGPPWLRMHGGNCPSCHGDDGKGGFQIMMTDEEAPSITWEALTGAEHDEHEDEEEEEEEHASYDKRTIERAITKGLDPSGQRLDSIMPRWEMNQAELDAISSFLKKLD